MFAPLLKSENEQSKPKTQESDDEQPDTKDTPDLESEESAAQEEQSAKGFKILTPSQLLSRLPTSLAQLNAGNNSEQLKIKIRQLFYSLFKFKKLAKNIYRSLVDII